MTTLKPPQQASELKDTWFLAVRDAASRAERGPHAAPYRAGLHAATIEVWSGTRGWINLLLPSGSVFFSSADDRDEAIRRIKTIDNNNRSGPVQ